MPSVCTTIVASTSAVDLLAGVVEAADQEVEVHPSSAQRRRLPRGRREESRLARGLQRGDVTSREEDCVVAAEWQRPVRVQLLAEQRDRALSLRVDVRPGAPRGQVGRCLDVQVDPELGEATRAQPADLVVAERGEELTAAGEPRQLARETEPPPAGSAQLSAACTMSPAAGSLGTRANSTHST